MVTGGDYLLDNQQVEAGQRFDALASLFNPSTFRHLDALGLTTGWRVWEVGAGGSSVPAWIAARTATPVLATDIDTAWLNTRGGSVEVRRHDVGVDPAPDGGFDLVHARLVLVHVTRRERALATMVDALRPGGWLLLEEADPGLQPLVCPDEVGDAQRLANQLKVSFRTLMAERGADLAFGRTLPRLLRSAGLAQVQSNAFFPMGGPACDEIERHLENVTAGRLDLATSPMVSAWGQKPE
ncbi:MAG: class I SAM-dependent methyltransferase [Acidimicrobiales bacterium]